MGCSEERFADLERAYATTECGGGSGCDGIRRIKEGEADVALGLVEIEKAKKAVRTSIAETEDALKALKCCQKELDKAGAYEAEGLRDIRAGVRMVENELKKPHCFPPICTG